MSNIGITKLKKTELIDIIMNYEENKFNSLKEKLGIPYNEDEEWIDYIIKLQELNAERCRDCEKLLKVIEGYKVFVNNSHT